MEGLVVYYSRTGNTRKIGKVVADELNFETREIIDKKDRSGFTGYVKGGWDAWREKRTQIGIKEEQDLSDHDIVVVGTPVWAAKPAPAVATYLDEKKDSINKIAFFCTCGGSGYKSTLNQLKNKIDMEPVSTLVIKEAEIDNDDYEKDIKRFTKDLRS